MTDFRTQIMTKQNTITWPSCSKRRNAANLLKTESGQLYAKMTELKCLSSCNIISWHVIITRWNHNVKRSVTASEQFDLEMKSLITFFLISLCLMPVFFVLVSTWFKVHVYHIYTLWSIISLYEEIRNSNMCILDSSQIHVTGFPLLYCRNKISGESQNCDFF